MPTPVHMFGQNYRISISDGAATPVYSTIAGESQFSRKSSSDKIDLSSKDDGNYKAMGAGQQEVTISASGKVSTPDTGFSRLVAVAALSPPFADIKITRGTTVVFQGNVSVGNLSFTASNNQAVEWSVDFYSTGAPTVDNFGL